MTKTTIIILAFYYGRQQEELRGTHLDIFNVASYFKDQDVIVFTDRYMPEFEVHSQSVPSEYRYFKPNIIKCGTFAEFKTSYSSADISINPRSCVFYYSGHATSQQEYCFPTENIPSADVMNVLYSRLYTRCSLLMIQDCCNGPTHNMPFQLSKQTGTFERRRHIGEEDDRRNILLFCSSSSDTESFSTKIRGSLFTYHFFTLIEESRCERLSGFAQSIDDNVYNFDDTVKQYVHVYSSFDRLGYMPDVLLRE